MSPHPEASPAECPRQAEALADLVDGPIDATRRAALDEHLTHCPACRALLADLREIRAVARSLETLEPPARVRRALARRLREDHRVGTGAGWRPVLAATALAAAAVVSMVVFPDILSSTAETGIHSHPPSGGLVAGPVLALVEAPYREPIRQLEQLAATAEPVPEPAASTLAATLAVVEAAIVESRAAVSARPDSKVARARLRAGLRHKVALLRTTAQVGARAW